MHRGRPVPRLRERARGGARSFCGARDVRRSTFYVLRSTLLFIFFNVARRTSHVERLRFQTAIRPRLLGLLPEKADDFDRAANVGLAGKPDGPSLPALADEPDGLQQPDLHRESLEAGRRSQVFRSREREHGARRALAVSAAPVPEASIGVESRVPKSVTLPDVDLFAVDHAPHLSGRWLALACHDGIIRTVDSR